MTSTGPVELPTGRGVGLQVVDISFSYGLLQVLFGISFEVAPGEAFGLLGTNGAGKSTVLRVASGLGKPSSGRILLDGEDITGTSAEHLVHKGLVLVQGGRAVFSDLTVDENLEVQTYTIRRDRSLARSRRELVFQIFPRLAQRLRSNAGSLSGGEQQQLALAKALLLDPKVLCIDELSVGLAPIVVQELLGTVTRIQSMGVTVVLVEQSLNIVAEVCSRAVFMEKGKVKFDGVPSDLLRDDEIASAVFLGGAS